MKNLSIIATVSLVLFTSMSSSAGIIDFFTSSHVDWNFIQSAGGMAVGEPKAINQNEWFLPIECNIAGTREITVKPTTINSGLALRDIKFKIEKQKIKLWVVTCLVTKKYNTGEAKGITLHNLADGQYQIEYLNPDGSTVSVSSLEIKQKGKV